MEDIQAARSLAAKILDPDGAPVNSEEGVPAPVNSKEGVPDPVNFDKGVPTPGDCAEGVPSLGDDVAGDSVPSASPKVEVPDSDPDSEVPVSDLRPRRKRKTEVENLEIDLKGWNSTYLSPMIQSLVSDNWSPHNDEDDADSNKEQPNSEQSDSDLNFVETDSFTDCIMLT